MKLNKYKRIRQIVAYNVVALNILLGDGSKKLFTYEQFADIILKLMRTIAPKDVEEKAAKFIDIGEISQFYFVQQIYAVAYGIVAMNTLKKGNTEHTFTYQLFAQAVDDAIKLYSPYTVTNKAKITLNEKFELELQKTENLKNKR